MDIWAPLEQSMTLATCNVDDFSEIEFGSTVVQIYTPLQDFNDMPPGKVKVTP